MVHDFAFTFKHKPADSAIHLNEVSHVNVVLNLNCGAIVTKGSDRNIIKLKFMLLHFVDIQVIVPGDKVHKL